MRQGASGIKVGTRRIDMVIGLDEIVIKKYQIGAKKVALMGRVLGSSYWDSQVAASIVKLKAFVIKVRYDFVALPIIMFPFKV